MIKADLNTWLSTKQNFFCLKTPNSSTVTVYGLGESATKEVIQPAILVCPFESTSPFYWPIKHQWIISIDQLQALQLPNPDHNLPNHITNTTAEEYQQSVIKALNVIQNTQVEKVVLAQRNTFDYQMLSVSEVYHKACGLSDSFAYALKIQEDYWLGASPELFLRSNYNTCETVALAGTRLTTEEDIHWGDKEILEQSVVAQFIAGTFEKLGLQDVTIGKQFTKSLGHIQHICNSVTANTTSEINWNELLSNLHPTPALAGFPKQQAMSFITTTEAFPRSLYGGFLGVQNVNEVELFVNIRCAQLFTNGAVMYAGAGINADSDPLKEWEETQNKLEVMKSILG